MATGIGGEIVWICPSLSSTNGVDDLSGSGNNGTIVDASVVSDTDSGGTHAIEFSGETNRVEIGRPAEVIASPNDFSLSAWVYADTLGSGNISHTIWGGYVGLTGSQLWSMLRVDFGDIKYWYSDSSGGYASKTGPSISTGAWTHVAITIDSSNNIKFYVNGTLESTQTLVTPSSSPHSTVEWWIGQSQAGLDQAGYDEAWDGKIDDFRWFDRVLTEQEIQLLAIGRGYEATDGIGDEVIWSCPSIDDTVYDISGNFTPTAVNSFLSVNNTDNGGSKAWEFPSSDAAIAYGRPSIFTENMFPLSISVWIQPYASNSYRTIFGGYNSTSNNNLHYLLRIDQGTLRTFCINTSGGFSSINGPTIGTTGMTHLATTLDSSGTLEYYINGTLDSSGTFTNLGVDRTPSTNVDYNIASKGDSGNLSESFYGLIDDFRFFNRVLTTSEITSLASTRGYTSGGGGGEGEGGNLDFHPFNSTHVLD